MVRLVSILGSYYYREDYEEEVNAAQVLTVSLLTTFHYWAIFRKIIAQMKSVSILSIGSWL